MKLMVPSIDSPTAPDPISILFGCFKGSECLLLAIKEPCQSSTAIGSRQHQSITPGTVNTATGGQDPLSPVSFNLVVVDMKTKLNLQTTQGPY
ncbi:uncharacterized protein FFB14_14776 [Fusarium fujikuroi]|nr:uncharacterized protein FFB14_14776 [Fusarium fujikuroi]